MKIDISKVRYPEMGRIMQLRPNPHILLGREIVATEKRDGSCIGAYLDAEGNLKLRSRNRDVAAEDFHKAFARTEAAARIEEMLRDAEHWNDEYVVFGELMLKGKSPARFEVHDVEEFVVFDIWHIRSNNYMNYTGMYQHCYHFDIPVVEAYGTANVSTLESLLEFSDQMLEIAKQRSREGVVFKAYGDSYDTPVIFAKEKHDVPKLEKLPRVEQPGKVQLPDLPESEITGAIEKALADLGFEDFRNVSKAMPLVVQYVNEEGRKHNCKPPRNIFCYYQERLKNLEY